MGYTNKDFRVVIYSAKGRKRAKNHVKRQRRRAEQRETNGEHLRGAQHCMRWGYWHA
jgi:hypothetical protein